MGVVDHEGWLYHRSRKMARGSPQWIKGWFIIKGTIFYGFNSREVGISIINIILIPYLYVTLFTSQLAFIIEYLKRTGKCKQYETIICGEGESECI